MLVLYRSMHSLKTHLILLHDVETILTCCIWEPEVSCSKFMGIRDWFES